MQLKKSVCLQGCKQNKVNPNLQTCYLDSALEYNYDLKQPISQISPKIFHKQLHKFANHFNSQMYIKHI